VKCYRPLYSRCSCLALTAPSDNLLGSKTNRNPGFQSRPALFPYPRIPVVYLGFFFPNTPPKPDLPPVV
jgi:hypothetical protein